MLFSSYTEPFSNAPSYRSMPLDWLKENQIGKDYYKPFLEYSATVLTKPQQIEIFERLGSEWIVAKDTN